VTVGSKWGYRYTGEWRLAAQVQETKDLSLETLRRQLKESRDQLGDRLQLYQVHSATLESGILDQQDVLAELVGLLSEGLVIGLTTTGPRQAEVLRRALRVKVDGVNPFSVVQATWNVLERSSGAALAAAHAAGWGVIVKEALANGRLTSREAGERLPRLAAVAKSIGATVDQVAIAAALANPWADVVLSGAVTREQVRSNVGAIGLEISADRMHALAALAQAPEVYWSERSARVWT
jgi:aryl-alcohol dehydrogenase-like predicted oxidoreductase